ncbi:Dam family site-specific DNA-(adenine-N6)-methyltransferase [Lyngbya aestuarii]|uniref:Dam family site-specific DNA-(adenine-N6)-methyltransferase n=1 Tax=Lyngbya aestuarii TaxID=118322 RepID=UPI00403D82B3
MLLKTTNMAKPRPFLKWAGGKNRLIQQYENYFPQTFTTYYEPFLGGGAVFFYLSQQRLPLSAVLSDINQELINVYCCLKNDPEQVILFLSEHQQKHSPEYYYQVRSNSEGSIFQKAARIIYLNKTCFNGLYRENAKGEFNVPLGRYKNPKICDPALLRSVSAALENVYLESRSFQDVVHYAKGSNDFVYFDPPYHPVSSTSNFTAYSRYSFNRAEQVNLRNVFVSLASRGVKVMLSNSDCPFIRELYHGFSIHTVSASRVINSNAKKRGRITEVLITSY